MKALVAALVLLAVPAAGARTVAGGLPAPVGTTIPTVDAVAVAGNRIYLAGDFNRVGPSTSPIVALSAKTGASLRFPRLSGGTAYALAADGRGGWFLGGDFEYVGAVRCPGLAHVRANGKVTRSSCLGPNGAVRDLSAAGGRLYLAGAFDRIGRTKRRGLAAVSLRSGRLLPWHPRFKLNGPILAMAARGPTLYIGGAFRSQGGVPRAGAAAIDDRGGLRRWSPRLDFEPGCTVSSRDPERCDPAVTALAVSGRTVYLSGRFERAGKARRVGRAAVDARTGHARAWRADMADLPSRGEVTYGSPFGLAVGHGRLYESRPLGAFLLSTGARVPWRPHIPRHAAVSPRMAVTKSGLIISYVPDEGESDDVVITELAARTGRVRWQRRDLCCAAVAAIASSGNLVVASGWFGLMRMAGRDGLAAMDSRTGRFLAWRPRVGDGRIAALAVAGSTLYVGGAFAEVDGQKRQNLAAFDLGSGDLLPWAPAAGGAERADVTELAATDEAVYIGGKFETLGGAPRHDLGAVDARTGAVLPWAPDPDTETDAGISAIEVSRGNVYVSGFFHRIGGAARTDLAALDATSGQATPWAPDISGGRGSIGSVCSIAVGELAVYAGGTFEAAGGDAGHRELAAFDRTTGALTKFDAKPQLGLVGSLCDQPGSWIELELRGSTLFAAHSPGRGNLGGSSTSSLAALDAETGRRLSWSPPVGLEVGGGQVRDLASDGGRLYLGGELWMSGYTGFVALSP